MQRLEVSCAVRHIYIYIYIYIYMSLGGKGWKTKGYTHLQEEALDLIMWRANFGRVFEPVARE
jgi:hypothetical protein